MSTIIILITVLVASDHGHIIYSIIFCCDVNIIIIALRYPNEIIYIEQT